MMELMWHLKLGIASNEAQNIFDFLERSENVWPYITMAWF